MATNIQNLTSEADAISGIIAIDVFWITLFTLNLIFIIVLHYYMWGCISDKPLGSKTLFDTAFKDTLFFTGFGGSSFCLIDILSRFETVRILCSKHPELLTVTCTWYFYAYISLCTHNGCICVIRVFCIISLTFMEETLGETMVRMMAVIFTLGVSFSTCSMLVFLDEMRSGTAITIFVHRIIQTGKYN